MKPCRLAGARRFILNQPKVFKAWSDAADAGTPFSLEYRFQRPDGVCTWVIGQADAERNENGDLIGFVGTITDITALKRNEDELRQAAAIFLNTREGVMLTDVNLRIVSVNPAFAHITGYTETDAIGNTPSFLHSGRHDRDFYAAMWGHIKDSGHWQGEVWNRRKSGEVYPELLSISEIRDTKGQVVNYVGVFSDISKLKESESKLEFLAHHDPLTGLPNRLLLMSNLRQAIEVATRNGKLLAVLMMDLDRFKDVNDSYGHLAGDELLQKVATKLTLTLRGADTVCRLGGDEFVVVLSDISQPEDAARVANEIIEQMGMPWQLTNNCEVRIGASVGISLFPTHGGTPELLIQHADTALYLAKNEGRGRFKYFSENLTIAARARIDLEVRLRRALAFNELRVFYQPQIDVKTGCIAGAEALVRWQDPERGLISPSEFIPLAEETGLITEIGNWVLKEACCQAQQWVAAGFPPIIIAVNLSPHQFIYGDIYDAVSNVLEETGLAADYLEIELTESALMQREGEAVNILNRLHALGVRLAIDDFGTGYSSLSYLKLFPLDVLKIDKSFIDDIPRHRDDMEIAAAIIGMGHTLHLKVLAEGVETAEQLEFLKTQGCDLYQGYIYSAPVPADAFVKLLKSQK